MKLFLKKIPSSRSRTSDLRISVSMKPLQSSALPTELSKVRYHSEFKTTLRKECNSDIKIK